MRDRVCARPLAALAAACVLAGDAEAQRVPSADEEARRLVVMVTCMGADTTRAGAGIVVGAAAGRLFVATADHLVRPCRPSSGGAGGTGGTIRVALRARPDHPLAATLLADSDSALDLAMLRVGGAGASALARLPFDRLGQPDSLSPHRDEVRSLAQPGGRPWTVSSPLRSEGVREGDQDDRIQFEEDSIVPGHMGGALLTSADRLLVGMIVGRDPERSSRNDGYALRIDVLLNQVRRWGHPVGLLRPSAPATFASIAVGASHMCGLAADGAAYCWGENDRGQLGSGTVGSRARRVVGGLIFRSLEAVESHTCALATDGAVYCWGRNEAGLVGTEPESSSVAVRVSGPVRFVSLSVGGGHACGLAEGGAAYCWGANGQGQLGDGSTRASAVPVRVAGPHRFTTVSAGGRHSCALTAGGAAYCWGSDSSGALGDGSHAHATAPVAVAGGLRFTSLSASPGGHTCGITRSGALYCWGQNEDGQLGNGQSSREQHRTPTAVAGGLAFSSVAAGPSSTCGITAAGAAHCWGTNSSGRLGDGSKEHRYTPLPVAGNLRFAVVRPASSVADAALTCGLTSAGAVYCWGRAGGKGQAGAAFPDGETTAPTPIRP